MQRFNASGEFYHAPDPINEADQVLTRFLFALGRTKSLQTNDYYHFFRNKFSNDGLQTVI